MTVKNISIDEFDYPLPEDRIAKYPLSERDASKLLVLKDGKIQDSQFKHIGDFLPPKALLVFNETKVIRARLQFQKETGSHIEIFCLEPDKDYQIAFSSVSPVRWKCLSLCVSRAGARRCRRRQSQCPPAIQSGHG